MRVDVAHTIRPCRGEIVSGDAVVVRTEAEGTLLAVVDALGHGEGAAVTAEKATRFLRAASLASGLRTIINELHAELRASRGAAATLCLLRGDALEASGVGNVGLRSFGMNVGLVLTRGIIGLRLREPYVFQGTVRRNARLVVFSDGIRATFEQEEATAGSPRQACERLLSRYGRDRDDSTVLVADISAGPERTD